MDQKIFEAGAAREDITPPVGTLLYGYTPDMVSTSVHDPLNVTAAAFRQGEDAALLLSVTLGDFNTGLCDGIRRQIEERTGVPFGRILIAATHTHSGPNTSGIEGWGEIDYPYVENILRPAMLRASERAVAALAPAEISVGETESRVGINRRQQNRDGSISLGQNPWGAFDPTMTCVSLRRADTGAGILNMIHYGCHGTAAGLNHEISRDWSGVMTDRLEKETGILTAYWNGAQGDVGPRLTNGGTTGDIRYAEELGGIAALDAMKAYKARGVWKRGELRILEGELTVPYKPLPPRDEVEKRLASYEDQESLFNVEKLEYAHWRDVAEEYRKGLPAHDTRFRMQETILSLGDVAFVPFPFEIFSGIALRLRAYSPVRYTLSLSNTNGYQAYLPTRDQIALGGYEVACFLYDGAYTLSDDADQYLVEGSLRIMENRESPEA